MTALAEIAAAALPWLAGWLVGSVAVGIVWCLLGWDPRRIPPRNEEQRRAPSGSDLSDRPDDLASV